MTARLWRWLRDGNWVAVLILVAGALVLGYGLGRRSVKPTVETRTVTQERVVYRDRVQTQSNVAAQEQTRTRIETRWLPGKEVVRTEYVERATDTKRTDLAVRDVSEDRTLNVTKVERIAAPERNWAVTLQGGLGLDGRKVAAVSLERRLFGGVSVVGTVTSDKAAMCGVTVRF